MVAIVIPGQFEFLLYTTASMTTGIDWQALREAREIQITKKPQPPDIEAWESIYGSCHRCRKARE